MPTPSVKFGLTERQTEYLDWITNYIAQNGGKSPSYEEIGSAMNAGISSVQSVVEAIVRRGHLVNIKGQPRSLALPGV